MLMRGLACGPNHVIINFFCDYQWEYELPVEAEDGLKYLLPIMYSTSFTFCMNIQLKESSWKGMCMMQTGVFCAMVFMLCFFFFQLIEFQIRPRQLHHQPVSETFLKPLLSKINDRPICYLNCKKELHFLAICFDIQSS